MNQPHQPELYYPPTPPARRRGCGGCLGRAFILGLLLLAVLIFTGAVITGTLVYADFSREIEEGITKLDAARDRETFETTVITDRDGETLWEIFGEGKRTAVPIAQMPSQLIQATGSH